MRQKNLPKKPAKINYPHFDTFCDLIGLKMKDGTKSPGHAIKLHLGKVLDKRGFGKVGDNRLPCWQKFFTKLQQDFYTDFNLRLTQEDQIEDPGLIYKTINQYWTDPNNKTGRHEAFIVYYWLHLTNDYSAIARMIDEAVIDRSFEKIFGEKFPTDKDQADELYERVKSTTYRDRPVLIGTNTVQKNTVKNSDDQKKELPKNSVDEDDKWRSYPHDSVTQFYKRHHKTDVEEAHFIREQWTKGKPDADAEAEGIIRSLIENGQYGLQMPDKDRRSARQLFLPSKIRTQLNLLNDGYSGLQSTKLFQKPDPAYEQIAYELEKLPEPSEEFFKLALHAASNKHLDKLKSLAENELSYAIYKCVANQRQGVNQDLNGFFFDQLSKIESFSDFARGVASFLKARNDEHRGAVHERIIALENSELYLNKHFSNRSDIDFNVDLFLQIIIQKISTRILTTTFENLDNDRVKKNDLDIAKLSGIAGLNDFHFDNPDTIIEILAHDTVNAATNAMPFLINYNCNILRCIAGGYDASEFFNRNLIINKAIANYNPYLACVSLTPLIGYAELAGLPDMADKIYRWRHGGHPVMSVNRERAKSIDTASFGFQTAINLLTTYFMMKNRVQNGDYSSKPKFDATIKSLLSHESEFYSFKLKTLSRYYARFKADYSNDKRLYLESESYDAPSHHLYMGVVNDQFTQQ